MPGWKIYVASRQALRDHEPAAVAARPRVKDGGRRERDDDAERERPKGQATLTACCPGGDMSSSHPRFPWRSQRRVVFQRILKREEAKRVVGRGHTRSTYDHAVGGDHSVLTANVYTVHVLEASAGGQEELRGVWGRGVDDRTADHDAGFPPVVICVARVFVVAGVEIPYDKGSGRERTHWR